MPYFPYSRQSKKKTHRGAITARMIANLMKVAGVDHVITIDLHASQMQGFFKCPVDNLRAEPLIAKWVRMNIPDWQEAVVVSKNPGGTKRVTSLADALQLSFGIVTTERRRTHMPGSMFNSGVFEPMGTDGTNDRDALHREAYEEAEVADSFSSGRTTTREDHAYQSQQARTNGFGHNRRNGAPRAANTMPAGRWSRLMNGDSPSSPLSNSHRAGSVDTEDGRSSPTPGIQRHSTALGVSRHHDEDGYEEYGDGEDDESARDVITGRLIHGHIVDDDAPSPGMSTRSASITNGNGARSASDENELPEPMTQSFISVTSERPMGAPQHGLGGTGDATASDEEEEEDLRNPDVETTVTLVGNVRDKPVLIVDDMIDKAGSWIAAAETVVKRGGATKVYCMATHGLFGGDSLQELDACEEIEAVVVTDAFPIPEEKRRGVKKLRILDVSGLLAEAIRRNYHGESITQLYAHFD
ncbi:ribose-phosphate pyrophosphokinase 1 [Saxophila tyrrhenica]|uniref:ribose-phosphate diphosphokinase n=1 Tax=Saxophila tyrrhenica TaxID=1690608 RepID=A0AAV9PPJ1_9PEZI|nr:ribose-phosphate pyrophosphokinase 1 [Saxophila tyrrhenica]